MSSDHAENNADLLWEAVDLAHTGHTLTGQDVRRTAGAVDGDFEAALHALDLLHDTAPPVPEVTLGPGDTVGGYRITRMIGRGGMGVVYEALSPDRGRSVALKVLHPALSADPTAALRFKREADLARSLRHPNVVEVYDAGRDEGVLYYAMEYVPGESLPEVVGGSVDLDEAAVRAWAGRFAEVARALHAAHEAGIVHRDVKPRNILIDPDGRLRLVDFGIARAEDAETLTATSALLGTPLYMAPEQATGGHGAIGPATDIYALAATLFEVVTGKSVVDPDTGYARVIQDILLTPPPDPCRLNPAIPRELRTVLLRALEKRPADRYDSAEALAEEFDRVARGDPVVARPLGAVTRMFRWARRRPATVLAALCALLAVCAVCAVLLRPRGPGGPGQPTVPLDRPSWEEVSREAWVNLWSNIDSPRRKSIDTRLRAWRPANINQRDERAILLAWHAAKRGEAEEAVRILDEAGELPSKRAVTTLRGIALYTGGKILESKPVYERATALSSRTILDRIVWALYLLTTVGDKRAAADDMAALVDEFPESLAAQIVRVQTLRSLGKYEEALRICGLLRHIGRDDPGVQMLRAALLDENGNTEAARRVYHDALTREPRRESVRLQFVLMLNRRRQTEEASRVIAEGLRVTPESAVFLNLRGWSHHRAGRFDQAIADYRASLAHDPHLSYPQLNLGHALIAKKREAEAVRVWKEMLVDPKQPIRNQIELHNALAMFCWGKGKPEETLRHLRTSLGVRYNPRGHENLAFYLIQLQRFADAIRELDQLLELTPKAWESRARRGLCRLYTYDLEGARIDLERALRDGRGTRESWVELLHVRVLSLTGDLDTTGEQFAKLATILARGRLADQFLSDWISFLVRRTSDRKKALELVGQYRALKTRSAETRRVVDANEVLLLGREKGWAAAADRWNAVALSREKDDYFDGRHAWLRIAVDGAQASLASPRRAVARAVLEGRPVDINDIPQPEEVTDPDAAWLLGRAALDAGDPRRARVYLERAVERLRLGACHLDHAIALAGQERLPEARAALARALAKDLPALYAIKRLVGSGFAASTSLRGAFLERKSPVKRP